MIPWYERHGPSQFDLDAVELLRVATGQATKIGSPLPDSVPSPRVTEASSGPGVPTHPHAGAAVSPPMTPGKVRTMLRLSEPGSQYT